jgi:hypothetical protein
MKGRQVWSVIPLELVIEAIGLCLDSQRYLFSAFEQVPRLVTVYRVWTARSSDMA